MRAWRITSKAGRRGGCILMAALAISAGLARGAAAEPWPTRPVTLVMAYAPGTLFGAIGQALAKDLSAAIGQPVVNEVRAGAGGELAAAMSLRCRATATRC